MPRVRDAAAYRVGTATASRVYNGATLLWPPVTVTPPALRSTWTTGSVTGTTETVTLPTGWQPNDYVLLVWQANLSRQVTFADRVDAVAQVAGAIADYMQAWRITPTPGANSFVINFPVTMVFRFWCGAFTGVDPARVVGVGNNIGASTTAAIEVPTLTLAAPSTGAELNLQAGGCNSSASWTTGPSDIWNNTSGNASLNIRMRQVTAGLTAVTGDPFNRGLEGTNRNESACNIVLAPA